MESYAGILVLGGTRGESEQFFYEGRKLHKLSASTKTKGVLIAFECNVNRRRKKNVKNQPPACGYKLRIKKCDGTQVNEISCLAFTQLSK
jgi:hypothetical protein